MGKKVSEIVTVASGLLLAGLLTVCDGVQSNGDIKTVEAFDPADFNVVVLPASKTWESVAYGNGMFVAVAYNSNAAAYILVNVMISLSFNADGGVGWKK
jgi:hypothetical protein